MSAPVHTETCDLCGGTGAGNLVLHCPRCQGSGRVPVPLRGVTDPDEADERQELLERKLAVATRALERLAAWPASSFGHPSITSQDIPMRAVALDALRELSK